MSQKAKDGLKVEGRVPSEWNRFTVADGNWLNDKDIKPFSARDEWLAECIDEMSATLGSGVTNTYINNSNVSSIEISADEKGGSVVITDENGETVTIWPVIPPEDRSVWGEDYAFPSWNSDGEIEWQRGSMNSVSADKPILGNGTSENPLQLDDYETSYYLRALNTSSIIASASTVEQDTGSVVLGHSALVDAIDDDNVYHPELASFAFKGSTATDAGIAMIGSTATTGSVGFINANVYGGSLGFNYSVVNYGSVGLVSSTATNGSISFNCSTAIAGSLGFINSVATNGSVGLMNSTAENNSIAMNRSSATFDSITVNSSIANNGSVAINNSIAVGSSFAYNNSSANGDSLACFSGKTWIPGGWSDITGNAYASLSSISLYGGSALHNSYAIIVATADNGSFAYKGSTADAGSFAFNHTSAISGSLSFIQSSAYGDSFATFSSTASQESVAIGHHCSAQGNWMASDHNRSYAFGDTLIATGNQTVVGRFNDSSYSKPGFIVGGGESENLRQNFMIVGRGNDLNPVYNNSDTGVFVSCHNYYLDNQNPTTNKFGSPINLYNALDQINKNIGLVCAYAMAGGGGGGISEIKHDATLSGTGITDNNKLGVNTNLSSYNVTALSARGAYSATYANTANYDTKKSQQRKTLILEFDENTYMQKTATAIMPYTQTTGILNISAFSQQHVGTIFSLLTNATSGEYKNFIIRGKEPNAGNYRFIINPYKLPIGEVITIKGRVDPNGGPTGTGLTRLYLQDNENNKQFYYYYGARTKTLNNENWSINTTANSDVDDGRAFGIKLLRGLDISNTATIYVV